MNEDFLKLLYENIGGSKVGTYEEFVSELKTDKEFQNLLYTNIGGSNVGTFDEFIGELGFSQQPPKVQQTQSKTQQKTQTPQPQGGDFSTQIDWAAGRVNVEKPEIQKDYTNPSIDWTKGTIKPAVTVDGDFYQISDTRQTVRQAQDILRNSKVSQDLSTKRTTIERQPTAPTASGYSWGTHEPVQGLYELSKNIYSTRATQDRSKKTLEDETKYQLRQKELSKAQDNFVKTVISNINQTPDSYINTQIFEDPEGSIEGMGGDERARQEYRITGADNALSHFQQAAEILMGKLSSRHPEFDDFLEQVSSISTIEQYQALLKSYPNITQDPEYMQYEMLRQKYGEFKNFKDEVKDYLFQVDPETADLYRQKEFSKQIRNERLYNLPLFDKKEQGIIPESVDVLMRNAGRFIGRLDVAAGGILNLVGATETGGKLIRRGQDIQDLNPKDSRFDGFFEENFIKAGDYKIVFKDKDKKEIAYVRDAQGRQVVPLTSWEETALEVDGEFKPIPDLIKDKNVEQEYNWKVFASAGADTVLDLVPQIGGTAGFAKLAMSMGMGKAAAYTIGQGLSAATQVRGSALQALQNVPELTQDQRENIASVLASFTAVVSNINPLEKNLSMGIFSRTTSDYIRKNAAKIASGQMTAADIAKFGATQVASGVGAAVKETAEEVSESIFEKIVVNPIVNDNFKTKLEEGISSNEWKTTVGLASTVGLIADAAGNFKLNFKNPLHKQAFIFATQDPEIFKSYVEGVKKGDIEFGTKLEEVFLPVIQEISTLEKKPTDQQVTEIAEYLYDARRLKDKINTTQNPIRKKELEAELEAIYLKLNNKEKEVEENIEEPETEAFAIKEEPAAGEQAPIVLDIKEQPVAAAPAEVKAYDFDGTLFDNKTGKLTPLGEEVKQRIAEGEDITIITARDKENVQEIQDALSITPDKIEATGDEAKKVEALKRRGISPAEYFDADQAKLDAIRGGKLKEKSFASTQKVGDYIDTPVIFEGKRGTLQTRTETDKKGNTQTFFTVKVGDQTFDLGDVNQDTDLETAGLDLADAVTVTPEGTFEIRGQQYQNMFSSPIAAIDKDKDGNYVVRLDTTGDKPEARTFRGQIAEDLAYQITLQEITKNNNETEFEQFLEQKDSEGKIPEPISETKAPVDGGVPPTKGQKQAVEPTKKPQPMVESTKAEKVSPRAPQTVTDANTIEGFEPTNRKGEKIVGRVFTKEEDGTWKARVRNKNGKLSSGSNVNIPSVVEQLEKELEKRTTTSKPPAEVKAVEEKPSTKAAQETKKQISTKDVKLKKGEDFDNDRVYEVTYEGETIGRIYYDRSLHNSWLDADYTRTDAKDIFGDVLGTKEEALQAMVDRWNSKQEETPTEVKKEPTKVEEPAEAEEMFFEQKLPNKTIKRPVEVRNGKWYSTSQEATLEGDIEKQLDEKYPGVREGKVKPTETKTTEGAKDTPTTNEKAPKTILEKLGTSEKAVKAQIKKFFTDNIPGITPEQSQKLADANFIMWKAVANTLNPGKALQFMRRKVAQLGIISTDTEAQEMSTRIGGDLKFQIIGEKGAAALDAAEESSIRLDNLQVAREMETAGKDPKTIRLATGWERGKDGKWRYEEFFEIDYQKDVFSTKVEDMINEYENYIDNDEDPNDFMIDETMTLEEIYGDKNNIFKSYPELKNYTVTIYIEGTTSFSKKNKGITINVLKSRDTTKSLYHEVQHAIQSIEGFSGGTSFSSLAYSLIDFIDVNKIPDDVFNLITKYKNIQKNYDGSLYEMLQYLIGSDIYLRSIGLKIKDKKLKDILTKDGLIYINKKYNIKDFDKLSFKDLYINSAGEVEARNAAERQINRYSEDFNSEELLSITEDVSRDDQIVDLAVYGFSDELSSKDKNYVRGVVEDLKNSLDNGNIQLSSDVDPTSLPQVAENIVNNAIDHLESPNKKRLELLRGTNDKESRKNIQQTIQENKKTIDHLKRMRKDPKFSVDASNVKNYISNNFDSVIKELSIKKIC